MNFSEITARLKHTKTTARGISARCPAHNDQQNSLEVKQGDKRAFFNCYAGCDETAICAALGINTDDLFFASKSSPSPGNNYGKPQSKQIVAAYDYRDEAGALLYQNVRFEPKDFRQRKPDAAEKDGWNWKLNGVRRVPYRLPELIAALADEPKRFVLLTEGEKDCDNLRAAGFAASSFKNWRAEHNQFIAGANVALIVDHDQSGIKQADDAAKIINTAAASVRWLDLFADEPLPDKHGKDVSDWLADAHTPDELRRIVKALPEWTATDDSQRQATPDAANCFSSLFTIQTASVWLAQAKQRPVPKMLFGKMWYEGEICILFADTNLGKSILAVQIADAISRGQSLGYFTVETKPQTVLYFDFELSDKQFEARYSIKDGDYFADHYEFDQHFLRAEINPESDLPNGFANIEEYLNFSLEQSVVEAGVRVLIVDNLTYLSSETERAKDALPLMKQLKALKRKYDLSIMALAHTPKRDMTRPLTVNDLQGSKMLANFADSIFAIGRSGKDENLRYLKQLKARNTEICYGGENVCLCEIQKSNNFLRFEFLDTASEREHLKTLGENDRDALVERAKDLQRQGLSQREISVELNLSLGTINNYLRS